MDGSWTSKNDCSNPDFVFQAITVDYSSDGDWRREHSRFSHPSYESQGHREVLVDVHKPHSLSGTGMELARAALCAFWIRRGVNQLRHSPQRTDICRPGYFKLN
jgi:hypothetical protein